MPIFDNGDCSFDFGKPPVFDENNSVTTNCIVSPNATSTITSTQADAYTWYTNYISSLSSFFTGGDYDDYYDGELQNSLFAGKTFYLENWNEQDKWWCGSPNSFTPQEYAVMSSTNYDAHEVMSAPSLEGFDDAVDENQDRKFVMGGLLDIEDLEILNETVRSIEL